MMTAVNDVNNDKAKVRDECIFRIVSLVCRLLLNLMCKLIHNRCKLTVVRTAGCVYANEQSILVVILCLTSENYTKTIIRLGLGEHW